MSAHQSCWDKNNIGRATTTTTRYACRRVSYRECIRVRVSRESRVSADARCAGRSGPPETMRLLSYCCFFVPRGLESYCCCSGWRTEYAFDYVKYEPLAPQEVYQSSLSIFVPSRFLSPRRREREVV